MQPRQSLCRKQYYSPSTTSPFHIVRISRFRCNLARSIPQTRFSSESQGAPDEYRAQYYGSVIRHDGRFKMWYVAADQEAIDALDTRPFYGWRPAYAESRDGIRWEKPRLGLVDYRGNRNNNLVLIDPPTLMGLNVMVLYEPDDPDESRRFKMMLVRTYIGDKAATSVPLYSTDGLRWRLAVPGKPVDYAFPSNDLPLPAEHFEQGGLDGRACIT